jgi:N utilization substance protein A
MGFKLKIEDLGRIAAQSAKQVIIQRMRDAEQEIIYEEYKDRKGEIVSGIIQRRDRSGWIINLGRTEALLPKEEQIPRERYKRGDRVQAFIIEVLPQGRGPQIIVSRTHADYMSALFSREVPEVADGTVRILGVARDPGSRAKVAVMSKDRDVDPVGACVGIRGSRIQNIVQELRGERIDIVVWSPEIAGFARNALSPASGLADHRGRGRKDPRGRGPRRPTQSGHRPQGPERQAGGQASGLENRHLHRIPVR